MLTELIDTTALFLSVIGAGIVVVGSVLTLLQLLRFWFESSADKKRRGPTVEELRLRLGRTLILGLEFLIGADIVRSVIQRSWEDIAALAVLIVLRSLLSYFLERDVRTSAAALPQRR